MCRVIFDQLASQASAKDSQSMFSQFEPPPPEEKKPVPWKATVEIPEHECLDQNRGFHRRPRDNSARGRGNELRARLREPSRFV